MASGESFWAEWRFRRAFSAFFQLVFWVRRAPATISKRCAPVFG